MEMQPTGFGLLSLMLFLPALGALGLALLPSSNPKTLKAVAMLFAGLTFAASLLVLFRFRSESYHFQMVEYMPWIERLGISYHLGVDGISIWLVVLTAFLQIIALWFSYYVDKRLKQYLVLLLLLETAMLGVFLSLDLILFYTFFEASLIPMWLLIAVWGGERRRYAGLKFFIFTFAGSIFLLVGMITIAYLQFQATGRLSFNLLEIQQNVANGRLWGEAIQLQAWIFWAFAVAFLVKTPAFPVHTWLPDAHVEAPTAGSIILAGVLLKMGTYGFLRFLLPLFPDVVTRFVPHLMVLAVVGILYGAIVAAVQPDVKKLVAYSSVAHMGFVMLGIFSLTHSGMMGGAMQQLNHGISTGALFLLIGLIYERRHTRMFKDFGGLKAQMPIYATIFLIVMLSSVGLPGTNGFIGEFLALMGAFEASVNGMYGLNIWFAVLAGSGVILAAVYLLWMFQKMFYGPNENPENRRLKDLKPWEIGMCLPLLVLIFWGGLHPNTFLAPTEKAIHAARMMALNEPGQRPLWTDVTMEIDRRGNLARTEPRTRESIATTLPVYTEVVAPARVHYPWRSPLAQAEPAADGPQARLGAGGGSR